MLSARVTIVAPFCAAAVVIVGTAVFCAGGGVVPPPPTFAVLPPHPHINAIAKNKDANISDPIRTCTLHEAENYRSTSKHSASDRVNQHRRKWM